RFGVFKKLVRNYRGPISVSLWIRDDEFKDQHFQALHDFYESEPLLKQYVDVHVVVDRFDFQLNMWRNVARLFARTDYFMLLDVDFHICTDLRKHLQESPEAMQLLRDGNALVLPAFEYTSEEDGVDSATFPVEKHAVEALVNDKKLMAFHSAKFVPGHGASDYPRWYKSDEIYKVTTFNHKYEPYVVLKKEGSPWCDERFVGYGANKAACLYEIYISGVDYYVLPGDFLIHQSHAYLESKRSGGRKLNAELYAAFRDELCFRYARAMYFADELDSPKAANMKSQCSTLKGFKAALEDFPKMWPTTSPPSINDPLSESSVEEEEEEEEEGGEEEGEEEEGGVATPPMRKKARRSRL
ncbi:glycosyl-transferase for dystroglycan-domain-containing protein, partial [Dissophora ornata]